MLHAIQWDPSLGLDIGFFYDSILQSYVPHRVRDWVLYHEKDIP